MIRSTDQNRAWDTADQAEEVGIVDLLRSHEDVMQISRIYCSQMDQEHRKSFPLQTAQMEKEQLKKKWFPCF